MRFAGRMVSPAPNARAPKALAVYVHRPKDCRVKRRTLHDANGKPKGFMAGLFDTHPDPAVRIAKLREMAM